MGIMMLGVMKRDGETAGGRSAVGGVLLNGSDRYQRIVIPREGLGGT
jgi:hypothetical protein